MTGCPSGSIRITDTINGGSQTINHNGPVTILSRGKPGSYTVTATCSNGVTASARFVVTNVRTPTVTLTPSSTPATSRTVDVSVTGCPPGPIQITDTINGGSQTIKHDKAPAAISSPGHPGKYTVTAKCSDGAVGHATFIVRRGKGPTVTLSPTSTGPTSRTVKVGVTGCPPGPIHITDTINGGSQTIKHDNAPASILSRGRPGNYNVTARCSDGEQATARFVVTPRGGLQTGDGTTTKAVSGPSRPLGIGLLVLAVLGAAAMVVRRHQSGPR